jgi:hypothetical protein
MLYIGPISSIFDFLTFFVLLNYFMLANSSSIPAGCRIAGDSDLVILIRTAGGALRSKPSTALITTTVLAVLIGGVTPLAQTRKLDRRILILLYGSSYWNELINFEALVPIRSYLAGGPRLIQGR